MDNSNLLKVVEILKQSSQKAGEIEEISQIPRSTLSRVLKTLVDDKLIKNVGGVYSYVQPTPVVKDIFDAMYILHQQKMMDGRYRKMKPEGKTDDILISYINNPNMLKGKIDDYHFSSLLDNITKASLMLKQFV